MNQIQPFTWLDVQRELRKLSSQRSAHGTSFVAELDCFADGADIGYVGDRAEILNQLRTTFGRAFTAEPPTVTLQIGAVTYPLELSLVEGSKDPEEQVYPLWKDLVYSGSPRNFPQDWSEGPPVISFHSFKGGVGRTTALMTYAAAFIRGDGPKRILLIDGDLEAPGISFWLNDENQPNVSFIQFLEAVHYPPADISASVSFFANELRKTSINVGGTDREIFVLPAALNISDIKDMSVQPEHLARNLSNPWILTDAIQTLGKQLNADLVFVDLRAGLSELASPILFDPRVEHFFVTTVAPQSVSGMVEVLRQLHQFQSNLPSEARRLAKPSVVISLLTDQLRRSPAYTRAVQLLNEAYPAGEEDSVSAGIELLEAGFQENLMTIGAVREALEVLQFSSLYQSAQSWAETRKVPVPVAGRPNSADRSARAADSLRMTCERFQFAERASTVDMLVTDPLRNLAKHYSDELPNTVSVGAKGAGKTFTFLQLCRSGTWREFVLKLTTSRNDAVDGLIYPLLASTNVENESLEVVRSCRKLCEGTLGFKAPIGTNALTARIQTGLKDAETNWDELWESLIVGEIAQGARTFEEMNEWLTAKNRALVLVVDGIEDIFDTPENDAQRAAIKSLLLLPNRLNQIECRRLGLVCFVRADYVQAVIRQNLAQYLSRFQAFRLEWTPESFLRLAYWICGKAAIIDADADSAEKLTAEQLIDRLEKLWGKKMGSDRSKEANSARWVFAALCDLNGRLQARDIVRFLKFAATLTAKEQSSFWSDRVLAPEAMRRSLPDCSAEKVREAASEIKALQQWQELLGTIPVELKKVPFRSDAVALSNETLATLRELGIVYEDIDDLDKPERFYLPEIYRTGLGFQSSASGRPRIQALLKRNLGRMPF